MKEREQKELIKLLNNFYKELDCRNDCFNCEYGIMDSHGNSCPLDIVEDMIYTKFNNEFLWKKLRG